MTRAASLLAELVSFILIASTQFNRCDSAQILGFFPSPSKSHLLIHAALADTLARAGHNVTVVATLPNVYSNASYNFVQIHLKDNFNPAFLQEMINNPEPIYKRLGTLISMITKQSNDSFTHPEMQDFLHQHKDYPYDLVILGYFMNDFYLSIGAYFRCPIVISFMIKPIFSLNAMVANPGEISYVPLPFGGLMQPMSFLHRVKNFLFAVVDKILLTNQLDKEMGKLYNLHFPPDRYPSLDEVKKNVSLIFVNHHFSQGPIRPNVPAIVEIGGIQIKEKADPLPEDLNKILNSAKNGVIYFSLGSNVQGSTLKEDKAKIMFNVLSKLEQTVLWKWGDSDFPGESSNIFYRSWLPQDDILAHPNIKLFITHGGQGSVVESQYHGVPMVGIPLFGDQPSNMAIVENSGYGLSLDYLSLTEEKFRHAILEVLNNPKYSNAVKRFSTLYRDRPMTPRQTVLYWVEYVLRHKGAKHLQSPAVHMNFWQLNSLDVIGFLLGVFAIIVGALVAICRFLCCRGKSNKSKKVKFADSKKKLK